MDLDSLIKKYTGKFVEVAGSPNALNQCTDLANLYFREVLGLPIIEWTNACDFPTTLIAKEHFDFIKNTPTGLPNKGDIIVWNKNAGGGCGHISIFIEGTINSFKSFEQNWPLNTPCHIQGHYYNNVAGWMRPKGIPMGDSPTYTKEQYDSCMADRKKFWEERDNALQVIGQQAKKIKDKDKQISKLEENLLAGGKELKKTEALRKKWYDMYTQQKTDYEYFKKEYETVQNKLVDIERKLIPQSNFWRKIYDFIISMDHAIRKG